MKRNDLCCKCNINKKHISKNGKEISYCYTCNSDMKKESYKKHPEASKIWHTKDYQNNKENYQTRAKKWYENNKEKIKLYGKTINARFAHAKSSAKKRKIEFLLSKEEYAKIYINKCYYCDDLFDKRVEWAGGLDRLDSSKPYIIENVVSCCAQCNSIKGEYLSKEEAKAVIQLVLEMRNLRSAGTMTVQILEKK